MPAPGFEPRPTDPLPRIAKQCITKVNCNIVLGPQLLFLCGTVNIDIQIARKWVIAQKIEMSKKDKVPEISWQHDYVHYLQKFYE